MRLETFPSCAQVCKPSASTKTVDSWQRRSSFAKFSRTLGSTTLTFRWVHLGDRLTFLRDLDHLRTTSAASLVCSQPKQLERGQETSKAMVLTLEMSFFH